MSELERLRTLVTASRAVVRDALDLAWRRDKVNVEARPPWCWLHVLLHELDEECDRFPPEDTR
jgi:hypothetical protein